MTRENESTEPAVRLIATRYRIFVALAALRAGLLLALFVSVVTGIAIPMTELQLTIVERGVQIAQFAGWLALLSAVQAYLDEGRDKPVRTWTDDMVFSYFIPFANLFRPAATLIDAVVALARRAGRLRAPEGSVYAFWGAWIAHGIAGNLLRAESDAVWYGFMLLSFALLALQLVVASEMQALAKAGGSAQLSTETMLETFR